jgi:pyruvate,orthophosphate dikinase
LPHDEAGQRTMANEMGVPLGKIKMRVEELHEFNPMMGHRGCRLGISYPEITEMQARAVIEAALNVKARALTSRPRSWCRWWARCANSTPRQPSSARPPPPCLPSAASNLEYLLGTMIETPRAALIADSIGKQAEFFSFGTNDLTQMTWASRATTPASSCPTTSKAASTSTTRSAPSTRRASARWWRWPCEKGRAGAARTSKLGVCGEHGGDPASVAFFHRAGLDYVSCSPFRVPIARLAAAQAANIEIMRTFVRVRALAATHVDLAKRLSELEEKTEALALNQDTFSRNTRSQFKQVFEALRELMTPPDPPKRPIGFVLPEEKSGKRRSESDSTSP